MPTHESCKKRLRQEKKRNARNHYVKMTIRSLSKKNGERYSNRRKRKTY